MSQDGSPIADVEFVRVELHSLIGGSFFDKRFDVRLDLGVTLSLLRCDLAELIAGTGLAKTAGARSAAAGVAVGAPEG